MEQCFPLVAFWPPSQQVHHSVVVHVTTLSERTSSPLCRGYGRAAGPILPASGLQPKMIKSIVCIFNKIKCSKT